MSGVCSTRNYKKCSTEWSYVPLESWKSLKTSGATPTRKPKKLENEWACTHSKLLKIHKRVGLHPLVPIKLFQSSGEENRARIKKVYFHGQNLQYMQNLQRECTHSFFKKAAFRVDLHPLKNQKNVKSSGPTHLRTHTPKHPHTYARRHSHPYTPHSPHLPLPKKISKAIYIAPSAFQKHKSFLLPQKRNGEPLLEKKQGARRFRNGTYLVYSFFNLLSKAALLAMIILSHSMRETERSINMPFAKDERFL